MSIIEINTFQTDDGRLFTELDEAKKHQIKLEFLAKYQESKLYGSRQTSPIDGKDMLLWLLENKGLVLNLIGKLELTDHIAVPL